MKKILLVLLSVLALTHCTSKSEIGTKENPKKISLIPCTKNKTFSTYLTGNFSRLSSKKKLQNLMYFKGNKILILDSLGVYPTSIRPDIVVFTQSPKINLERLLQTTKPKMVVADASNYKTIQTLWKATCLKAKIPFHATDEKGFYRLE